jgi:hypothetical protein
MTTFLKSFPILVMLILTILLPLNLIPFSQAQSPSVTFSMHFPSGEYTVPMSPGMDGNKTLDGWISITDQGGVEVHVTLSATLSTDWAFTISPKEFNFTGTKNENFKIVVTIPKGTYTYEIGKLVVIGTALNSGQKFISTTETQFRAQQYHDLSVNITPNQKWTNKRTFLFAAKNTGNGPDSYEIFVFDEDWAKNKHINIYLGDEFYPFVHYKWLAVPGQMTFFNITAYFRGNNYPIDFDLELWVESYLNDTSHTITGLWKYHVTVRFDKPADFYSSRTFLAGITALLIVFFSIFALIVRAPWKRKRRN